jgi:hypothetical protein
MLVIKAYINYEEIEEIWIHNMDNKNGDIYEYRIENPTGFEYIPIHHKRSDGWSILAEKALNIINKER